MVKVAQQKQQRKQKKGGEQQADGGAIDLGTVATPLVLYGLHTLLKDDGKKAVASVAKPFKRLGRRGFAKRGGAGEEGVAVEMEAPVAGGEEMQEDFSNFQQGGKKDMKKKPWGKKIGGEQQQDQEEQDGGKKKQRKQMKKGGEQQEQQQDQEEQQDGGKKKQRKMKKGGEQQEQEQEQQDGGKKKQRKQSSRKQKGGDAFAALEDYYKMPLDQPAPVLEANNVATQDAGVAAPPAAPEIPPAQEGGKKKQQRKRSAKKGGAGLENLLKDMGLGQVNYTQDGKLAAEQFEDGKQQGGALEQYTQQLQQLSKRLDDMIRGGEQQDGGKKKKAAKKSAKKSGGGLVLSKDEYTTILYAGIENSEMEEFLHNYAHLFQTELRTAGVLDYRMHASKGLTTVLDILSRSDDIDKYDKVKKDLLELAKESRKKIVPIDIGSTYGYPGYNNDVKGGKKKQQKKH